MIIIVSIGILAIIATAYITSIVCNYEYGSSWQVISYTGSSVEPKEIYICKRCNKKVDVKYCYCPNCGANMRNGMGRNYYTNGIKIDLDK